MDDLSAVYKELLASNEGDILVRLKDGKQLKIISFLIKMRSPVFKTMLESSMQEATTGLVDLSSRYSLEAFREFMAYIYHNKLYSGSYVPLLFEILCITDYYGVDAYRTYISDRIIKLITDVPICLVIASEARKHGTLTDKIYSSCLGFLVTAIKPQRHLPDFIVDDVNSAEADDVKSADVDDVKSAEIDSDGSYIVRLDSEPELEDSQHALIGIDDNNLPKIFPRCDIQFLDKLKGHKRCSEYQQY
ncbi:hypothetical protein BG005_002699 [Podila minutissima]|nr:hypothetical protein BG005_002699 [Podila minutissima]